MTVIARSSAAGGNSSRKDYNVATVPLHSKSRFSSMEPLVSGTSWNSVRWNRPLSMGSQCVNRTRNMFEPSTSAASSLTIASTPFSSTYSLNSAKERSISQARSNDSTDPARNRCSRYGSGFTTSTREAQSLDPLRNTHFSPPISRNDEGQNKKSMSSPYTSKNWSEARTALLDIRQKLRPIKKYLDTVPKRYSGSSAPPQISSSNASPLSPSSSNILANLMPFTSAAGGDHRGAKSSMAITNTTVGSITPSTSAHRPIPKSERPWRQRLADSAKLRESQQDLDRIENSPTTSKILALRESRRQNAEQQHHHNPEQQFQRELNALKNYVSNPSALDKNATVAKFRSRFAEDLRYSSPLGSPTVSLSTATDARQSQGSTISESRNECSADELSNKEDKSFEKLSTNEFAKKESKYTKENSAENILNEITTSVGTKRTKPLVKPKSKLATIPASPLEKTPPATATENSSPNRESVGKKVFTGTEKPVEHEDEGQYNAIVQFRSTRSTNKARAGPAIRLPVPGAWQNSHEERCISCNRHLYRTPSSESVERAVLMSAAHEKSTCRILILKKKSSIEQYKKEKDEKLHKKADSPTSMLKIIRSIAKPKIPAGKSNAVVSMEKEFNNKRRLRLGIQKTIRLRISKPVQRVSFKCQAVPRKVASSIRLNLNILFKEQRITTNATLLLPQRKINTVNWYRITGAKIKETKRTTAPKFTVSTSKPLNGARRESSDKENAVDARGVSNDGIKAAKHNKPAVLPKPLLKIPVKSENSALQPSKINVKHPENTQYRPTIMVENEQSREFNQVENQLDAPLILPDESVLEEYVRRKRMEMDKWNDEYETESEISRTSLNQNNHRVGHQRYEKLSAPPSFARQKSSNAASSLPASNRNSLQIGGTTDSQLPLSLTNSFNSNLTSNNAESKHSVEMNHLRRQVEFLQPSVSSFEPPKSLFEEKMQEQAIQIQQNAIQRLQSPSTQHPEKCKATMARRPSGEISAAAQAFSLAVSQPRQPERYAAHIPYPGGGGGPASCGSGRQSVNSIDSTNSGVLDLASRQLDQMIDQARFRHNQHRNRFKEAINYLDNIFEDFQKEAVQRKGTQKENAPNEKGSAKPRTARIKDSNQNSSVNSQFYNEKIAAEKRLANKQQEPTREQFLIPTEKNNRASDFGQKNGRLSKQSNYDNFAVTRNNTDADIEVRETIILPSKSSAERLDYTRKWLTNEISSWANNSSGSKSQKQLENGQAKKSKVVSLADYEDGSESEHSLGSCSAEVAAINAADQLKSNKTENVKIKPKLQGTTADATRKEKITSGKQPIKPQPYRPQPQFPIIPIFLVPSSERLNTVSSTDCVSARFGQERASSQDCPKNMNDSQELKPLQNFAASTNSLQRVGGGAFVEYSSSQKKGAFSGSIQSLPDGALLKRNESSAGSKQRVAIKNEHALAVDALVAELELNIDPHNEVDEKRRSFPTTDGEFFPVSDATTRGKANERKRDVNRGTTQQKVLNVSVRNVPEQCSTGYLSKKLPADVSTFKGQTSLNTEMPRTREQKLLTEEKGHKIAIEQQKIQQQLIMKESPEKSLAKKHGVRLPTAEPDRRSRDNPNPFQTINDEKLSPSRVDKYSRMFEQRKSSNSGTTATMKANVSNREHTNSINTQIIPAIPTMQTVESFDGDPKISTGKKRNGKMAMLYRGDAEGGIGFDDDVYDNIEKTNQMEIDDQVSVNSQVGLPPPTKRGSKGRIGQIIKKLSGTTNSKPPISSVASSLSLQELEGQGQYLLKSTSLSNEQWTTCDGSEKGDLKGKVNGIGNRIKQTIFGATKKQSTRN